MLIDTHCHLNFEVFETQVKEVIEQAKKAGVEKIIVPGTDLETSKKGVELAQKYKNVWAAVGIHPHHTKKVLGLKFKSLRFKIKEQLEKLAKNRKVVAVGECGLDYYQYQKTKYQDYKIDKDFKERQKEISKIQIQLASKLNLPLIVHNRDASEDLIREFNSLSFKGLKVKRGVIHCFDGNEEIFSWALKNNFMLGITGNITYNEKLQAMVKKIPLKNLLVETDSPYLIPEPLKSQHIFPNHPKNVRITAYWIAKLKGDSFLKVARQTTKNANQLFKL